MTTPAVRMEAPSRAGAFVRAELERRKGVEEMVALGVPAPVGPLEAVLAARPNDDAFLWDPREGSGFAAIGVAESIEATGTRRMQHVKDRALALLPRVLVAALGIAEPKPRYFGGFSFQAGQLRVEPWHDFGDARFVLPRFTYARDGAQASLTVVARPDDLASESRRSALASTTEELLHALELAAGENGRSRAKETIRVRTRTEMSELDFRALVERALERIGARELDKVVVARMTTLSFDTPIDVCDVLRELEASEFCTRFAVRIGNTTFLGATPERLVRVSGLVVDTEALAGSSDAQGATALLESRKERVEHDLVVNEIIDKLTPMCDALDYPRTPEVRALRHLVHLRTPIHGRLERRAHVLDLVARLHPTPAVGGVPSATAQRFIAENEPVPRGWYASPIGWFDAEGDGEFAVGLRSGAFVGDRAYLYAGNGIVSDSDPTSEYAETKLKLAALSSALHVAR
jgi:menaquinone-specific isochorismate synthase